MPPGGAPAAPVAPSIPTQAGPVKPPPGGGKEAEPGAVVQGPKAPEASMAPDAVADRQQLVVQIEPLAPDPRVQVLDQQHEARHPQAQEGNQQQQAASVDTNQAAQGGNEVQQAPGQKAYDEIKALNVTIGPDTNFDELYNKLQQQYGWQQNDETKKWVQDALIYAQVNQTGEVDSPPTVPGQAASENAVNGGSQVEIGDTPVNGSQPTTQEASQAGSGAGGNQAEANAQIPGEQPEGVVAQQSGGQAEQATVAGEKEAATAKGLMEAAGHKEKVTLSPDERALMKGFTEIVSENPDHARKFFEALVKDDPLYAKELQEKLKIYNKLLADETDAKKSKLRMAAGLAAFILYVAFNVATTGDGNQH